MKKISFKWEKKIVSHATFVVHLFAYGHRANIMIKILKGIFILFLIKNFFVSFIFCQFTVLFQNWCYNSVLVILSNLLLATHIMFQFARKKAFFSLCASKLYIRVFLNFKFVILENTSRKRVFSKKKFFWLKKVHFFKMLHLKFFQKKFVFL